MHKRGKFIGLKGAASAQIFLLILSILAIAFIIGETNVVSADGKGAAGLIVPGAVNTAAAAGKFVNGIYEGADGGVWSYANNQWYQYNNVQGGWSQTAQSGGGVLAPITPKVLDNAEFFEKDFAKTVGNKLPGGTTTAGAENGFLGAGEWKLPGGLGTIPAGWASLARGVVWAAAAYGAGQLIGSLFGLSSNNKNALSTALAAGAGAYQVLQAIGHWTSSAGLQGLFSWGGAISVGIAALVFIALYKTESTQTVTFTCQPFQPQTGGTHCEECNNNPMKPCSEYRCKSLGQACEILNKGKASEKCAWVSPNDVTSPTITPSTDALSPQGLSYIKDTSIRPPALGVKIVDNTKANNCLAPFTKLKFGITTNEPSTCKIDYTHTGNISNMKFDLGEDADFAYNHTQEMRLPGGDTLNNSASPIISNDGTMSLFIRCADANGNQNVDEYKVSFCVDKAPDNEIPQIEGTSIISGSPVRFGADNTTIEVYTNKPADCKWSSNSGESYENMPNSMSCSSSGRDINARLSYTCSGVLTGIKDHQDNNYYFKCKSKAGIAMTQSYPLILRGTQSLNIVKVAPNETVFGSTNSVPVELTLETANGENEGNATCYYSATGAQDSYLEMYLTNNYLHNQSGLSLTAGDYTYYFRCVDLGGNNVSASTTFSIFVDNAAPVVTSAYKDSNGALRIVTNENAECTYSLKDCNFDLKDGIALTYSNPDIKNVNFISDWKSNTVYYIKCKDAYGNEPDTNTCTVAVNAVPSSAAK